jgi:hypothetical protein
LEKTTLWEEIQVGYDASKVEHMPNAVNIDDKGFMSVNHQVLVAKVALEKQLKQLQNGI